MTEQEYSNVQCLRVGFGIKQTWVPIPTLSFTSPMSLRKFLAYRDLQQKARIKVNNECKALDSAYSRVRAQ